MVAADMHVRTRRQQAAPAWREGVVGIVLFSGTLLYLAQWPHNLGASDEGIYLYQSKRILNGDVFFRDIFDIIPPGAHYLMAAAFWLFGTTMTTARIVNAIMHGVIVLCAYASARVAGAGMALAFVAPMAHLALCQAAWPVASPHWLASTLTMIALLVALRGAWRDRPGAAIGVGVVLGMLIMVQQQKGVLIAAAMNAVAVLLGRHDGRLRLRTQLLLLNAGIAAVVVPAFTLLAAQAGVRPIFYALVQHTFVNYRHHHETGWGSVPIMTGGLAAYTFPTALKYLPMVLLLEVLRVLNGWWRGGSLEAVRSPTVLLVFGSAAVASIAYFPDFIHIGFIGAIFFVIMVELLDRGLHRLGDARASVRTGVALAAVMVMALGVQLHRNLSRAQSEYPVMHDTAFGRISFRDGNEPSFVDTAERLLRDVPSREMFTYPFYASLYLTTSANNPTPYQFLFPRYSGPEQVQEVIGILDARRVPLVFAFHAFLPKNDTLMAYIRQHYVPADEHQLFWTRRPG